jgi:hypothetical protein
MTLHERAARAIENEPDLARVPHPVIEAVVREAVRWIAWHVPAEFDAAEMDAIDFDACGIWLCDACHVELTPPAGVAP